MAGDTDRIAGIHRGNQARRDSEVVERFEQDAALERRGGRRVKPSDQFATTEGALAFLLKNVPMLREDLDEQDRNNRGE